MGTDTGNSTIPKSVVPDFETYLPDEVLQSDSDPTEGAEYARAFSSSIAITKDEREKFEELGSLIEEAFARITEITSTPQTISLGATPFRDDGTTWEGEVVLEDDLIRIYFRNSTTDELEGTYLFLTNSYGEGDPGDFCLC